MEYGIREWLDSIVDSLEQQKSLREFNSGISICIPCDSCLVREGIEIISDLIGLRLFHEEIKDGRWKYRYSFTYRGVNFYQYEENPLKTSEREEESI